MITCMSFDGVGFSVPGLVVLAMHLLMAGGVLAIVLRNTRGTYARQH